MIRIAVLISGEGSNLQALIDACASGRIKGSIVSVVSNNAQAYGLQRAQQAGIEHRTFLREAYTDNQSMDVAIADYLQQQQVDLVVLAGYMKILTPLFIQRFNGKILNIHPSLLPKYPGLNTYQRAIDAGDDEHGTTVHFVNEAVDAGAIVLQAKVPVFADDSLDEVMERVKAQEVQIYPLVVAWFAQGRLQLRDEKAYLDGQLLAANGYAAD
ncbi:phosphoribosylglycinamide formyltransferase [Testudinibacter sp. TR-2022]|uniref:phosphoribosylglycinamide formyltransferase n=1 Tax=Testudinibacter sp. TR-2022 TaxID=2585029 RepID=UPI00111A5F91|nr:phosphoribosylglycinamide formyltransferase [Testudinibacter sp. TR-2022]TNH03937.1 phosphoribosylglycinamide formyltransferase [Pasteurellaceae bacterium Phil31]TNH07653.1 phosphoribosylglycinamide formyltransferase [Testudinibacter sp. TR-2022]TNH09859.1 phosphoribosylglycinamide formyltransferase [Testudinibacter sp. TR-2022]TNH17283.1 phosphoribosylglycinamide formyltransferase [Testudinibacter sp. TR-2022]TNH18309.1 phosphoribosylglycinamide formyltransferase [Testudinibacter sp. TR-20